MPRLVALLSLLAALLLAAPALALDPRQPIHRYALEHWSRDNGLPSTSVQQVLQTADGYLWLGTQDGLVRYDGARFVAFHSRNTPEILNNNVQALAQSRDGALWFSTLGGGVVRMHRGRFEAWTRARGLSSDIVRAVLEDRDGALWVGTDEGLDRLDGASLESWDLGEALGDSVVETLYEDEEGRLWVASRNGGACIFAEGACHPLPLPGGLDPRRIRALLESEEGRLWIGTEGDGLLRIDGDQVTRYSLQEGLSDNVVTSLLEDRDGSLWIGTKRGGLNRLGPGGPEVFSARDGLSYPYVTSLQEDREGNLWVGTYAGGLNSLREASFVTYGTRDGLGAEVALTVLEDRLGYVWVGTMKGLYRLHGERAVPFAGMEQVKDLAITGLYQDSAGALWVGTFGQGLRRFADGQWTTWTSADGLPADYVYAIAEDTQGTIWIGTQKGLCRLVDDTMDVLAAEQGLAHETIRLLHLDRSGTLWIGSDGGGLQRWDGTGFTEALPGPDAAPNLRQILTVHEGQDGALWFGTEGGLIHIRDDKLATASGTQGLWDERIWRILEDDAGSLWMSSNLGVYRVEKAALEALFTGEVNQVESQVFGKADGMASAECNGGYVNAGARSSDGRLWFPTTKGVAVVDPAEALRAKPLPSVIIETLHADEGEVDRHQAVVLAPGTWRLAIGFTAPTFTAPDKVRFRYRLAGQSWSQPTTNREAGFTNLPPGRHRFEVGASNGQGRWSEQIAALEFTVQPFFWQTHWFLIAAVLSALLLVAGFLWIRERQHQGRERELEAQVQARTQELRRMADEHKELALRDSLTSLRNRRFLHETVRPRVGAIARQQTAAASPAGNVRKPTLVDLLGLAIVDIDHFKWVNDTHGHDAGDAVLRQFSRLLTDTARGHDVVVRWGGEEFLVVLAGADEEGLRAFGERLRKRVEAMEFQLPGGATIHRSCSVGLVGCPFYPPNGPEMDLDQMVNLADLGLYQAKRTGRNRSVLVKPGPQVPEGREQVAQAFATVESALEGGYAEMVWIGEG